MAISGQQREWLGIWLAAILVLGALLPLRAADASTPADFRRDVGGCGCLEVGPYEEPAPVVGPYVKADGSSAAADPTYRVTATGSLPAINLTVRRVSDNSVVMSITTAATNWGFSPDEDRFVTHRVNSGVLEAQLYNLVAANPTTPVLQHAVATSSTRLGFSPGGRFFAFTWIWSTSSNTVSTIISNASSGAEVYDTTYTFSVAGGGDEFGVAGWGFSPDGDELFMAWATGASTIQLNLVNLATGLLVYSPVMTGTGLWRFSPCGSLLAKVEQNSPTQMNTVLVRSLNGTSAASRTDPVAPITFRATAASHIATIAGVDHVLAPNEGPTSCPDSENPTWPAPATLTASDVASTSLTLEWSAAADDVDVTSYRLYQDDTLVDTVGGGELTAEVTGLSPNTTYEFVIQAGDAAGNWSTDGPTAEETTSASIPTWPDDQVVVASKVRETTLTLTWGTALDVEGVTGYRVLKDGTPLVNVGSGVHTHDVSGLVEGTTYTFTVQARDADANFSTDGPSTTVTTNNFTVLDVNEIRGLIYQDNNSNGIRDSGEPGVNTEIYPYVGIYAYRIDGTLMLQNRAGNGSASGNYKVASVADGQWLISLIISPRIQTGPADLQPHVVDVVAGHGVGEVDFGIRPGSFPPSTADVGGTVWNDLDGDGVREGGENGLPGIDVNCYSVPLGASCDYPVNDGATSGADGSYAFLDAPPGTMALNLYPPPGWYPTTPNRVAAVSSNGSASGLDFGVVEGTATVAGRLFRDHNQNGVKDPGEDNVGGMGLQVCIVYWCSGVAADGTYLLDQLPPREHTLTVSGNDDWVQTPYGVARTVVVTPGQVLTGQDIGVDGDFGTVRGLAWDDLDEDGVHDPGEPGIPDVEVCLWETNGEGSFRCTQTRDDDVGTVPDEAGLFRFDDVPAGEFEVVASSPDGYEPTNYPDAGPVVELVDGQEFVAEFGFADDAVLEPPGAPTDVSAAPGDRLVALTWDAPVQNGGAPVTDYMLEQSVGTGPWTTVADGVSTTRSATVSGLTNGTTYKFRVAAHNVAGHDTWSTVVTATPRTVPGPVRSLAAKGRRYKVKLTWDVPASTGGAAVGDYVVQMAKGSRKKWKTLTDGRSSATKLTVKGLVSGAVYTFRVAAVNDAGRGPWSHSVTALPGGKGRQSAFSVAYEAAPMMPAWLSSVAGSGVASRTLVAEEDAPGGRACRLGECQAPQIKLIGEEAASSAGEGRHDDQFESVDEVYC